MSQAPKKTSLTGQDRWPLPRTDTSPNAPASGFLRSFTRWRSRDLPVESLLLSHHRLGHSRMHSLARRARVRIAGAPPEHALAGAVGLV